MRPLTLLLLTFILASCQWLPEPPPSQPTPALNSPLRKRIAFFTMGMPRDDTGRRLKEGLYTITPDGNTVKFLRGVGASEYDPDRPILSFDGQKIIYSAIMLTTVDGVYGNQENDILLATFLNKYDNDNNDVGPSAPAFSPDGRHLGFLATWHDDYTFSDTRRFFFVPTDRQTELDISSPGGHTIDFAWSPDGYKVAVSHTSEIPEHEHQLAPAQIYIDTLFGENRAGVNLTAAYTKELEECSSQVVIDCKGFIQPAWSPDGKKIAFVGDTWADHDLEIYVVNADGTDRVKLTDNDGRDFLPLWSLDGKKILFLSDRDGLGLFVMNADGSGQKLLTNDCIPDHLRGVAWSPDSQQIVFVSCRSGDQQLYMMNADGSNQRQLTDLPGEKWGTVWIP